MHAFIRSSAQLSPQHPTFEQLCQSPLFFETNSLHCIEPVYRELINPLQLRRMPRILKMGLGAAALCLQKDSQQPESIVVGTGLGCVDDLDKYLRSIIDEQEQTLSPISFINSTTNNVASQIAMTHKNHGYNTTYCHRTLSFELSLIDALMLINEQQSERVLVGAIDENIENNRLFYEHCGRLRMGAFSSKNMLSNPASGTLVGEGASFFMLGNKPQYSGDVLLRSVDIRYGELNETELNNWMVQLLSQAGLSLLEVNVLVTGQNGDATNDLLYRGISDIFKQSAAIAAYKHLCGDYFTASGFGLWLTSEMLKHQLIPGFVQIGGKTPEKLSTALIYDCWQGKEHSLMLLQQYKPN